MKPDWRAWWVVRENARQFVVSGNRCWCRSAAIDYGVGVGLVHGAINLNARRVYVPARALRAMRRRAE